MHALGSTIWPLLVGLTQNLLISSFLVRIYSKWRSRVSRSSQVERHPQISNRNPDRGPRQTVHAKLLCHSACDFQYFMVITLGLASPSYEAGFASSSTIILLILLLRLPTLSTSCSLVAVCWSSWMPTTEFNEPMGTFQYWKTFSQILNVSS